MFEHFRQPLISPRAFAARLVKAGTVSLAILAAVLIGGAGIFRLTEKMPWLDSFLNSVLIMTGQGMTKAALTAAGKFWIACYALAGTVAFYAILGIMVAPLLHRLLHRFHMDLNTRPD